MKHHSPTVAWVTLVVTFYPENHTEYDPQLQLNADYRRFLCYSDVRLIFSLQTVSLM